MMNQKKGCKKKINPRFDVIYTHHVTYRYRPDGLGDTIPGKKVQIKIIGQVIDENLGIQAAIVESGKSANKYPHITISAGEGVKPVTSNEVIERAFEKKTAQMFEAPIIIEGTDGYFDGSKVVTGY